MDGLTGKWEIPPDGLWGFSHCGFHDTWYPWSGLPWDGRLARLVGDLVESGADSFRPQVHWHQVEPVLTGALGCPGEVTGEMVGGYASGEAGVSWDLYDDMVDALVAAGIEPHLVIAAAYDFQVPCADHGGVFTRATPDRIGHDRYLAHAYLHARAAVRRYKDRVHLWQLENELNGAGETMLAARWRTGRSWLDSGFLTAIVEVLSRAVREEDPGALTSHNFHTDARVLKGVYDWRNDVTRWIPFLDVVGVDPFPNYLVGRPVRGSAAGRRVAEAVDVASGRPVMVLESGYPVRPAHRGMSESGQSRYVREAVIAAADAGACGFYYYELCSPEGYPVHGPWSDRFFQSIEPWWGLVRSDDSKRPAFYEYQRTVRLARRICAERSGAGRGAGTLEVK